VKEFITDNKFVELTYKIVDESNGDIVAQVEVPLGYVHGENSQLFEQVTVELEGKSVGDTVEVPIDCNDMFGKRNESLTFTDDIDNVPEEYRRVGAKITMENGDSEPRDFYVSKIENGKLTVDGNNPLCGKKIIFILEVLSIRDATDEEFEAGGTVEVQPDLNDIVH
jgi:FKBP-type peptidyl-prolyl cis-trans isomerase SlyD